MLSDAQIEAILQRLVSGEMRMDEAKQAIERLRRSKKQGLPHLLRMMSDSDESTHITAAQLLVALEDRSVVPPLLELFDDPTVDDWCKLSIFNVLQYFNVPVDAEALYRRLRDPQAVARRSQEGLLNSFSRAPELAQFLNTFVQYLPLEERPEMIYRLAEMEDPRAVFPLRAALHMSDETVVLAAIEGLNMLRAAVAIPWLEKLARDGPTEVIRQEASKVAGHLTMRASVPGAALIREMPLLANAQWPLHSCWLTTIDGSGGQIAFVARERSDGYLMVVDMMFNDHEGLKECFGADMIAEEEFQEMLAELSGEGIAAVEVSLERCREAVESAYDRGLAVGRRLPLEYFAWEGMLAGEEARSVEESPVEEVDITAYPQLLANSIELLALEEMESWFFNPEEIDGFVERYRRDIWRLHMSRPRMLRMLRQGVESVVDEERRALLHDRLRRQAWLLAQTYADEEVWRWAMAASAGLSERGIPSDQHPLLLGMMGASLDNLVGTDLLDELLEWEEETWLDILEGTSVLLPASQPALPESAKLRSFLQETGLDAPAVLADLVSGDQPPFPLKRADQVQAALRALNWLESLFDEEIEEHLYETGGLDWRKLRQELGLIPTAEMKSPVLQKIEVDFVEGLESEQCLPAIVDRARQLWDDYVLLTQGQVRPLRKPASWAAGMEYLVHLLYFAWQTQAEAGDYYEVSAATVSKRYWALRDELGVEIFCYPFEKSWQAMERLEGLDRMSPEELIQRMLARLTEFDEWFPWEDEGEY